VLQTWLKGSLAAEDGISLLNSVPLPDIPNRFDAAPTIPADFEFHAFPTSESNYPYPVIEAFEGQLITGKSNLKIKTQNGIWTGDTEKDILKIVVVNRYFKSPMARAFIKNFGLKKGALASSVAHDSHNIVAIGSSDEDLSRAVNAVISEKGGISVASPEGVFSQGLPVAGLMSTEDGYLVAERFTRLDTLAKSLGSDLASPFMTLSFMALLVIPHLKLSDLGLFDGDIFQIL